MYDYVKIFSGYYEAIQDLEESDRLKIYDAICRFGLYEEEPELSGVSKTIWKIIKPLIEANHKNSVNGKKGGRPPKKDTTKKPTTKSQDKKSSKSYKSMEDMGRDLVELFTKPQVNSLTDYPNNESNIMTSFIMSNSDEDIENDIEKLDIAYMKIRNHLVQTENIYSLTYKTTNKSKKDDVTKEIHKHTSFNRNSLQDLKADKGEIEFYDNYWDNCKDKTVTVMGIEYDINLSEQMFFLSGTKKTGNFTEGRILEEIWKLQK